MLVERYENALFEIHRELAAAFPQVPIDPRIADVGDQARMDHVFEATKPELVFHAAAHKHVPMMEWNPGEAVKNNVGGTRTLADLADRHRVLRFVLVSTDKAVNPTSVMGATKRVAEIYLQALSRRSQTRFVTVRFGNVLGSAGSVIPIFREQIARGGPITVTHPDMRRYFMTIPEASQLVMQAGAMGEGGEIFILDMGEPVKIVDLARDLITLSGLRPDEDIEIKFAGVRPGEKLFEELSTDAEHADKTKHPKVFIGRIKAHGWESVIAAIDRMIELALVDATVDRLREAIVDLVPEYLTSRPSDKTLDEPAAARRARRARRASAARAVRPRSPTSRGPPLPLTAGCRRHGARAPPRRDRVELGRAAGPACRCLRGRDGRAHRRAARARAVERDRRAPPRARGARRRRGRRGVALHADIRGDRERRRLRARDAGVRR